MENWLRAIESGKYDTIICNYLERRVVRAYRRDGSGRKAVEALDHCVEQVASGWNCWRPVADHR